MTVIVILILLIAATLVLAVMAAKYREVSMRGGINAAGDETDVKKLALSLRMCNEGGAPPTTSGAARAVKKTYKCVRRKKDDRTRIYDAEKWVLENYYLILRRLDRNCCRSFVNLPHKDGRPRICILSDYIVRSCNGALNSDKIGAIVGLFNKYTPLNIEEIESLPSALCISLGERIAADCRKLVRFDKFRRRAESGKIKEKYVYYDSYIYYYLKNGGDPDDEALLRNRDINPENAAFSFETTLSELNLSLSGSIDAMRNMDEICGRRYLIKLSNTYTILSRDKIFRDMDVVSQYDYLSVISRLSRRYGLTERAIADSALALQDKYGEHFGVYLYDKYHMLRSHVRRVGKSRDMSRLYVLSVLLIAAALCAGLSVVGGNMWYSIAGAIISFAALFKAGEDIANRMWKSVLPKRPIPKMDHKEIPDDAKTLVVVSELASGKEDCARICANIARLTAANGRKNLTVSALVDLPRSKVAWSDNDDELVEELRSKLKEIRNVDLFVRKRVLKDDGDYGAYERKRGAIMQLNDYLVNGNADHFAYIMSGCRDHRYVILLDGDNEVAPGTFLNSVNTISHPLNARYDLMAYSSEYNLYSLTTPYSARFLQSAGKEEYCNYSNLYYDMSGKGIFTGKGIYDVRKFYDKLNGAIPEGRVLSHDLLEGAILDTGALNDVIYEDAPTSLTAENERGQRWKRGDVQLLPFAKNRHKNSEYQKITIEKPLIYKYLMWSNAIGAVKSISLFTLLALSALTGDAAFITLFAAAFLLPYALRLISAGRSWIAGKRIRYVLRDIVAVVVRMTEELLLLPFYALSDLVTVVAATIKTYITHSNMLEWKTFRSSQEKGSMSRHLVTVLPSIALLTAVAVLSALFSRNIFFEVYALLSSVLLLASYYIGDEYAASLSPKHFPMLEETGRRIYDFFDDMRTSSHLICDNYQVNPDIGASKYTSPTNIGFSMIAEICGYRLGKISLGKCVDNIMAIINAVRGLEKYCGHLYNWYSVSSGHAVEPRFISSVDSANFTAALMVVRSFLKETGYSVSSEIDDLIDGADFSLFYIESKDLFAIGYDTVKGEKSGNYDILASESRLLNLIASVKCARYGVWNSLSRDTTSLCGNTLLSWSGTMFEYMMPELFLKEPKFGMLSVSCGNAVKTQLRNKCKGLFGISESGYYAFDEDLNYQYHAFGLDSLAERNDSNSCVVSPYSTFLAMPYAYKRCMANLKRLENVGLCGKYGYFEAIDLIGGTHIVESYMSHHQGMSISAIVNALYGGYITELFMKDPLIDGSRILLTDKRVESRSRKKADAEYVYDEGGDDLSYAVKCAADNAVRQLNLSTNGRMSYIADDVGNGCAIADGKYVNLFGRSERPYGGFALIQCGDKIFSPTYAARLDDRTKYETEFRLNKTVYSNKADGVSLTVTVPYVGKSVIKKYTITNDTDTAQKYVFAYYEELALSDRDSEESHPVFNKMFVATAYFADYRAILAHRKSRERSGGYYAAISVKGLDNIDPETNRYNFIGRYGDIAALDKLERKEDRPSLGDVLEPCFGFYSDFELAAGESKEIIITETADASRENIFDALDNTDKFEELTEAVDNIGSLCAQSKYFADRRECELANYIASYVDSDRVTADELRGKLRFRSVLAEMGVDVGLPIVVYVGDDGIFADSLRSVKSYLRIFGIAFDLVIISDLLNGDNVYGASYSEPITSAARLSVTSDCEFDHSSVSGHGKLYRLRRNENTQVPPVDYAVKGGGFNASGEFVVCRPCDAPYSNVVSGKFGGFIATENGGGYTFFDNSRENKFTAWYNDPVSDLPSERVYYLCDNGAYRINRGFTDGYTVQGIGYTRYVNTADGNGISLEEYVVDDGRGKCIEIEISNNGRKRAAAVALSMRTILDWNENGECLKESVGKDTVVVTNVRNERKAYIKCTEKCSLINTFSMNGADGLILGDGGALQDPYVNIYVAVELEPDERKKVYFVITPHVELLERIGTEELERMRSTSTEYFGTLNRFKIESKNRSLPLLYNKWLTYQVVSSRLNGRCGYYQAGGAIGFRDQLQDCLAMIYMDEAYVREHILDAAAHQYEEGDVMHWWHEPSFGVRTAISDDKLFLPYLVAEYVKVSGDKSILDERAEYLTSPPLIKGQEARLEHGNSAGKDGSIKEHCLKALESALAFGEHDLLLIGSGDWNDALNSIGTDGRGESVWLSMFFIYVVKEFEPIMTDSERDKYRAICDKLSQAVMAARNSDGRFMRAFTDGGEWLGSDGAAVCKYDLITQCFAVIADVGEADSQIKALKSCDTLIDKDNGIVKLFSPPMDRDAYYGYISAYPRGVRENGGQYTHGAVWYIKALCESGNYEKAFGILQMLNPVERAKTDKYKNEPYVLSADVYSHPSYGGQGGWSWYTGSAAWMYKVITENVFGITKREGTIVISHRVPQDIIGSKMTYACADGTELIITYEPVKRGSECGVLLDGKRTNGTIELPSDGKPHEVTVFCALY